MTNETVWFPLCVYPYTDDRWRAACDSNPLLRVRWATRPKIMHPHDLDAEARGSDHLRRLAVTVVEEMDARAAMARFLAGATDEQIKRIAAAVMEASDERA